MAEPYRAERVPVGIDADFAMLVESHGCPMASLPPARRVAPVRGCCRRGR
ncbi:MAG: hypothetical protein HOV66_06145 [Streptomycetaceae bacterium]|nr:hypothetical protein [Streptomycetaceae bacterium]NUS54428.1 hypothetical protein [Streptomycetaceae bacterium]